MELLNFLQFLEAGTTTTNMLKRSKRVLRDGVTCPSHPASKWQKSDFEPRSAEPQSLCSFSFHYAVILYRLRKKHHNLELGDQSPALGINLTTCHHLHCCHSDLSHHCFVPRFLQLSPNCSPCFCPCTPTFFFLHSSQNKTFINIPPFCCSRRHGLGKDLRCSPHSLRGINPSPVPWLCCVFWLNIHREVNPVFG